MEPRTKMAAPWAPSTSWALAAHWAKSSTSRNPGHLFYIL
jgi:hypothetical protein